MYKNGQIRFDKEFQAVVYANGLCQARGGQASAPDKDFEWFNSKASFYYRRASELLCVG